MTITIVKVSQRDSAIKLHNRVVHVSLSAIVFRIVSRVETLRQYRVKRRAILVPAPAVKPMTSGQLFRNWV